MSKYEYAGAVEYGEVELLKNWDMAVVGWSGSLFESWDSALKGFIGFGVMDFADAFNLNWAIALGDNGLHEAQYLESYREYRKLRGLTPAQEEVIKHEFHYLKGA